MSPAVLRSGSIVARKRRFARSTHRVAITSKQGQRLLEMINEKPTKPRQSMQAAVAAYDRVMSKTVSY